jgi:membrane protein implicated in regulation of membrane protease activity
MLDLGIDVDVWPWIWLILAVVFALVELTLIGGSFVLLPFAVSAFVAALLAFYDVAVEIQWIVFLVGGGLLFVLLVRWGRRFLNDAPLPLGVGADRLVGSTGVVTVEIDPDDTERRGRVAVHGEVWGALAVTDRAVPAGSRVRIAAMQGTRVVVEPLDGSTGSDRPTWPEREGEQP